MKTIQLIFSAVVIASFLLLAPGKPYGATKHTSLVSVNERGSEGDGPSTLSFISANGRYVVFQSTSTNLVPETVISDDPQVYLRDLVNNTTTLVSKNSAGTAEGNGISQAPTISADGSIIAFQSTATDLISGGISNPISYFHIYIHNRVSGATTLISENNDPTPAPCNGTSGSPYVSGDGKFVAFHSNATDLVSESVTGDVRQIYLRDLETETTTLISKNITGTGGNGTSETPSVSADGSIVAFHSASTDLVSETVAGFQAYIRDISASGTTTLISKSDTGTPGSGTNSFPKISADGRYVAFASNATNLITGGTTTDRYHVYLHDRNLSTTTLLSKALDGTEGNGHNWSPFISPDGRYVVFTSQATNLTSDYVNGTTKHIYIQDVNTNKTTLASISGSGIPANNVSAYPSISTNGKYVAFESIATNLTTPATNATKHIFVHDEQGMNILFMIVPTIAREGSANQ